MTARCSCDFTEAGDETLGDHLLEVFTTNDGRGNDGLLHEEADPALTCFCGFAAATAREMDEHFLAVFTPAGAVGPDGKVHQVVA
jgi:hypothetical protein